MAGHVAGICLVDHVLIKAVGPKTWVAFSGQRHLTSLVCRGSHRGPLGKLFQKVWSAGCWGRMIDWLISQAQPSSCYLLSGSGFPWRLPPWRAGMLNGPAVLSLSQCRHQGPSASGCLDLPSCPHRPRVTAGKGNSKDPKSLPSPATFPAVWMLLWLQFVY